MFVTLSNWMNLPVWLILMLLDDDFKFLDKTTLTSGLMSCVSIWIEGNMVFWFTSDDFTSNIDIIVSDGVPFVTICQLLYQV